MESITITVLYDNNPFDSRLKAEWGFSCLIEGMSKTILLDTGGDDKILFSNMKKLGIEPKNVNTVFLSHEHWDHIGGLNKFLHTSSIVKVFLLKSFPFKIKQKIKNSGAEYIEVEKPTEICKNVYSTGKLGTAIKEQSLIIKTSEGLVIITGCAHPGIVNIVNFAKKHFGGKIYLVLGGFHLGGYFSRELDKIVWSLRELEAKKIAPCHCSGDEARKVFEKEYGENFIKLGVGGKMEVKNGSPIK